MAYSCKIINGYIEFRNAAGQLESAITAEAARTNDPAKAAARQLSHAYVINKLIGITVDSTKQVWRCTTAGTSDDDDPTPVVFPPTADPGDTVTDGTAHWTCVGYIDGDPLVITTEFLVASKLHNASAPAFVKTVDGVIVESVYHYNGKIHRIDGPAVTLKDGDDVIIDEQVWVGGKMIDKVTWDLVTGLTDVNDNLTLDSHFNGVDTDAEWIAAVNSEQIAGAR